MIGPAQNHVALTYLAAKLNLPATQFWLSHNAPAGVTPPIFSRYPAPEWAPSRGWRVDRSLVYAHALQESRFVTDARSHAGRSEEHTSELQSLMRISYAVFCLKTK